MVEPINFDASQYHDIREPMTREVSFQVGYYQPVHDALEDKKFFEVLELPRELDPPSYHRSLHNQQVRLLPLPSKIEQLHFQAHTKFLVDSYFSLVPDVLQRNHPELLARDFGQYL
jgi:hypothetical protein